jgi:hypothetical protein
MNIILPKNFVEIEPSKENLFFFLIGPVRGGGDWQWKFCQELEKQISEDSFISDFTCAIPYYHENLDHDHPCNNFLVTGNQDFFERQLDWERYYIDLAAKKGCLIAWLPEESITEPHSGPEPYAMDTRGEIGEIRGRMIHEKSLRFVIGAERGFHGRSQIERNFKKALEPSFVVWDSIEVLAAKAIKRA